MIEAFKESPVLLLFIVSAVGYAVGNISIRGTKLGVAAVLFVGLGFGALDKDLDVPEIIIVLGLSIFVYTIGMSSSSGFFRTLRKRGVKDIGFIIFNLIIMTLLTVLVHFWFGLDGAVSAGLLSGSVTNTPSLAGLLDLISNSQAESVRETLGNAAVIGYSLSYPMGVLGVMLSVTWMIKWLKIDFKAEEELLQKDYPIGEKIEKCTVRITQSEVDGTEIRYWFNRFHKRVVFGRMKNRGEQDLPSMNTVLHLNDEIVIVGNEKIIKKVIQAFGEVVETELSYDRSVYDVRRLFVSNPEIAGEKIASLNLVEKYSTIITRVQRGDIDVLASGDTVLELGDRVLIVAKRSDMPELSKLLGNSYEALSHINLFSFGIGMALGLLIGMISFEFPGGFSFSLGFAGGPLIVALILGSVRRTGAIVWKLPYSANLTLRQFGLTLLLAGIGIRSGHTFLETILTGQGVLLFAAGAIITVIGASLSLLIGYKIFKIPFSLLMGIISSQPAVLDFSLDKAGNKLPNIGFTLMMPVGLIIKIVLVQLLFILL